MAEKTLPFVRSNTLLKELAEELVRLADASCKPRKKWSSVYLDVRYWPDGDANVSKVRVLPPKGESIGPETTPAITAAVEQLWQLRGELGGGKWYGLLMTVTKAGQCKVEYNHDRDCADDETFYDD